MALANLQRGISILKWGIVSALRIPGGAHDREIRPWDHSLPLCLKPVLASATKRVHSASPPCVVTDPASNDALWFAEHVLPHEPMLRAWLRARFPEIGEFDDIVQDAFARLLRARRNGALENPKAYLFAVARNLAMDHFRRIRSRDENPLTEIDRLSVLDESEGIPEALVHHDDLKLLTEAIQMLPDRCRQVLTLRKIYGLSQKEIAAQLCIAEHTVEAQVTIGIRKCTEFLRRHRER